MWVISNFFRSGAHKHVSFQLTMVNAILKIKKALNMLDYIVLGTPIISLFGICLSVKTVLTELCTFAVANLYISISTAYLRCGWIDVTFSKRRKGKSLVKFFIFLNLVQNVIVSDMVSIKMLNFGYLATNSCYWMRGFVSKI